MFNALSHVYISPQLICLFRMVKYAFGHFGAPRKGSPIRSFAKVSVWDVYEGVWALFGSFTG